jgi:two-component system chemotaxis response regulator CheB
VKRLRVLVVDDSRSSREHIVGIVKALDTAEVVGTASNGGDALRMVRERTPDAVTLDLEMPDMDGFSFLKVLMATRPLPVIVVSSDTRRDSVLRALELGALDFVAKTEGQISSFEAVLGQKLLLVRSAKLVRASLPVLRASKLGRAGVPASKIPRYVAAIASSTGGPGALIEIFSKLSAHEQAAIVVAQHMPPRFTTTFAQRLDRHGPFVVAEAKDGDVLSAGRAYLCPGNRCLEIEQMFDKQLIVRVVAPVPTDRFVPNASRLLTSVGNVLGPRAIGVVLTGMGNDGAEGAAVIAARGGRVVVESEESAVIWGMPEAAFKAVPTATKLHLEQIPARMVSLFSR